MTAACVLHGLSGNGKAHDGCVHCELAQVKTERDALIAVVREVTPQARPLLADALTMIGRGARYEVADGRLKVGPITINLEAFDPAADAEIPDVHDDPSWGTESAERFGQGGPA